MTIDPQAARANEWDRLAKSGVSDAEARRQTGFPPKPPNPADFNIGMTDQQLLVRHYMRHDGLSRTAALELAASAELPNAPHSREQIIAAEKISVVAGLAIDKEIADRADPVFRQAFDQSVVDAKQRFANQADLARASSQLEGIEGLNQLSDLEVIEAAGYAPVKIPTLPPIDYSGHPEHRALVAELNRPDPNLGEAV